MSIYVTQLRYRQQPASVVPVCVLIHIYKICDSLELDCINCPYCVNGYIVMNTLLPCIIQKNKEEEEEEEHPQ